MRSSNSYRFVWNDAAINRDTNSLVTASIELFRNDDASITTNGVVAHLPRELPFAHDGFGQDDAWVAANFTNATEILAVGYPQWVDAQVGTGLTNGLYKLTINVADDPPETTQVSVGNLSIAVTNAGEYVFLLEKGEEYRMECFPRSVIDVQNMIAPLNDIYRQVGVSFYLDSVIVTNIPSAYNLFYDKNPDGGWDFDRLVDIGQGTGGIECYFVNDFIMTGNEKPPLAANSSTGLVMSARADFTTLAHEIGHAFGLSDVYVSAHEGQSGNSTPSTLSVATNFICYACAPFDWNGGCRGRGEGGCRYYQKSTRMATIVPRLLMYGVHDGNGSQRDITIGPVDAVNYIGGGESTVWYDEFAPIGFFENGKKKNSPNHE